MVQRGFTVDYSLLSMVWQYCQWCDSASLRVCHINGSSKRVRDGHISGHPGYLQHMKQDPSKQLYITVTSNWPIPNHVDTVATVKKVRFVIEKAWTPSLPPVFVTQLEYGWDKAVQCLNQKLGCFKSGIVIPPVVGDGSGPRNSLSAYQYRIAGETVLRKCQVLVTRSLKFTLLVRAGSLKPSEGRVWTCGIEEMAKARWVYCQGSPQ